MAIVRIANMFGSPQEFTEPWSWRGHRPREPAEIDALGREALERKGKQAVLEEKARGTKIEFDHVDLIKNDHKCDNDKNQITGERTSKCNGVAVGYVYVQTEE